MEQENRLFEESVSKSKTKRFGQTALDVILFIVLMFVINSLAFIPFYAVCETALKGDVMNNIPILIIQEAILLFAVLVAAFIVFRMRKMPLSQMGFSFRGKSFLWGVLFAIILYAFGFGLSILLGVVEIEKVNFQPGFLLLTFVFFLLVSITEEIAMRGFVLGRLLDGGVHKFWALLISSVLFSLMHFFNPNFAFVPFLNLILAGCLLGASYVYTRNLSFPIALHLFWNWIQGPVLGYEVSGNKFGESLFTLRLSEAHLLNGGSFGFEGSLICTVLMIVGTGIIILVPLRSSSTVSASDHNPR